MGKYYADPTQLLKARKLHTYIYTHYTVICLTIALSPPLTGRQSEILHYDVITDIVLYLVRFILRSLEPVWIAINSLALTLRILITNYSSYYKCT